MKEQNAFDRFFKIAILIIAAITSISLYSSSEKQRYSFYENDKNLYVFDTQTADIYLTRIEGALAKDKSIWFKTNPLKSKVTNMGE